MGRRCGAVFHKVVREGLYEKTLKLDLSIKTESQILGDRQREEIVQRS